MDNGYAGLLGWTVGRFDWLNDATSKVNRYWRVIEEGSAATKWPWEGQMIVGLWGPSAEPRGALHGTGSSIFGEADDEKFIPYFKVRGQNLERAKRAALLYLFGVEPGSKMAITRNAELLHGDTPNKKRRALYYLMTRVPLDRTPFVQGVVVKPIPPHHHYAQALEKFDPMRREVEVLREEIGSLLGSDITTPAGLKAARDYVALDSTSGVARRGRRKAEGSIAPGFGQVSVTAQPIVQDFIRDGRGQFSNGAWQDMIRTINERMAVEFQEAVVAEMEASPGHRPSTGRLLEATADPRNRYPN